MKRMILLTAFALLFSMCANAQQKYMLEKNGIGPLRLGIDIEVPNMLEGVYNRVEFEEEEGYYAFKCYNGKVLVLEVEDLIGSRNMDMIAVKDSNLKIDGKICVGMTETSLKNTEGVVAVKNKYASGYKYKDYQAIIYVEKNSKGQRVVSEIQYLIDSYFNQYK